MDRREALKKLGVTGIVVAGASTVAAGPAFAYDEPAVTGSCGDLLFSGSTISASIGVINIASAACPASAASTSAARSSTLSVTASVSDGVVVRSGDGFTLGTYQKSFTGTSTTTDFAPYLGESVTSWATGDTLTASLVTTFTCTYSDNTEKTTSLSNGRTWLWNGTAWTLGSDVPCS
jgi:hypothetical protein